jgi:Tfp pilus assembly protein PilW
MKLRRKNAGFTLVELMLTTVAAAILVLTVSLILFMAFRSWRINNSYAQLRRDVALAVQLMAQDVRESAGTNISVVSETSLSLAANLVRPDTRTFTKTGDKLNGTHMGLIITKGLHRFNPVKTTNGVLLHLELTDADNGISITNETFIYTRN